jgi:hypothetical protein
MTSLRLSTLYWQPRVTKSLDKQWVQIFCLEQECFLDVDYNKNGNAIQLLSSELIKNSSKANAKTPEFRPSPIFVPTQNPRENKDKDVSLLPQHRTPISDAGFQEIAAPRGATESAENMLLKQIPFLPPLPKPPRLTLVPLLPLPLPSTKPNLVVLVGMLEPGWSCQH